MNTPAILPPDSTRRFVDLRSAFDFTLTLHDAEGADLPFPEYDFTLHLAVPNRTPCVVASQQGGTLTNCSNLNGSIHVAVAAGHSLPAGPIRATLTSYLPDETYPGGVRTDVVTFDTGISLMPHCPASLARPDRDYIVTVLLPYIYIRAAEDIRDLTQILDTANEQAEEILGTTLGEYDASDYATDARLIKGVLNATNADNVEVLKQLMLDMADDTLIYLSISDTNEWKSGNPRATFATALAQFVTHAPYTYDGTTFNGIGTTYDTLGASVGDLLCIMRYSNGGNSLWEMKIVPLNDAKPANGDFPGSDGLETIWDKTQVNKVPGIEVGLNWHTEIFSRSLDERSFSTNTDGGYNINNCLTTGIYTGCNFGRSMADNHSDERYTVTVQTHWNESERMYYVQQHAYSENYPNRAFFRLIKTDSLTNYYGDYGQWYQIGYQNS
jgi:hypothetical protein